MSDEFETKAREIAEKVYAEFGILSTGFEQFLARELTEALRDAVENAIDLKDSEQAMSGIARNGSVSFEEVQRKVKK